MATASWTEKCRPTVAETPPRTPATWRAAALLVLAGGLVVGDRAATGRWGGRLVAAAGAIVAAGVIPVLRASRRPPIGPFAQATPLQVAARDVTFSVLVAGRDEAAVIPNVVRDIAAQDHRGADGRPRFELVVVDDRSSDDTGRMVEETAREAGIGDVTRIVRREGEDLPDGKGAALTAVQPDACRGDVVVVLDADARVGPRFLSILARYIASGADAVTARRRILGAGEAALAGAQADEQTLDGELQRGRWALGGCSEFRGNGIVIRRDLLAAVGGWRAEALTEDLDLSSRIAIARGIRVAWAIDAEVWEEPVRTWRGLWRQRVRWSEGALRRLFEYGPAMARTPSLRLAARLEFAAYAGQLVAPSVVIGAMIGAVRGGRPAVAGGLAAVYAAASGALAIDALRWEVDDAGRQPGTGERVARGIRSAGFASIWLLAVPAALWRIAARNGRVRYDKMDHVGMNRPTPTGHEPLPA